MVTSPQEEDGGRPMTTDGNYLALGTPAQTDQKEEEPPTMTASATGAGAAASPDSPASSDVEMAEMATPLQAIPSISRDSRGDDVTKDDNDVVAGLPVPSDVTSGGPTAGGGVTGGLKPGHTAEVSQHSQLLPDHVDLEHLDDDLDGLFEDSVNLDVAED